MPGTATKRKAPKGAARRRTANAASRSSAPARKSAGSKRTRAAHGVQLDDLTQLRVASAARLSPDGRRIVYVEKRVALEKNRYYHDLMCIDLRTGRIDNLTPGPHSDTQPEWTPDSQAIVFVSDRSDDRRNLWEIPLGGGEARQLTQLDGLLTTPRVSPDGRYVAFVHAPKTEAQKRTAAGKDHPGPRYRHITRLSYKLDGHGYWDDAWMHLYVLERATGKVRRLTSGNYHDGQHAWAPNSRALAFVSNRIPRADKNVNNTDIFVVSLRGGKARQVTRKRGMKFAPTWSPDGKQLAFLGHFSYPDWVEHLHVHVVPARGGAAVDLVDGSDLMCADETISDMRDVLEGSAHPAVWTPDGKNLYFLVSEQGAVNVYRVRASGGGRPEAVTAGKHQIAEFSMSADGRRLALVRADATSPGDVELLELGGGKGAGKAAGAARGNGRGRAALPARQRLTRTNAAALRGKAVQKPHEVWIPGRDGHRIHGWVLFGKGQRRRGPTVLMVHGGPYAMYGWTFFHEFQMLAAAGYHVVFTNIRGSMGYGREYLRAIVGRWGHEDYNDVSDVTDWIEAQPWSDAGRIAIAGGSYGGFMTNWAVGRTRRFKCAITMRSIADMLSFYGASDIGWDFHEEFGAHPWENYERYWRSSPLAFVEAIRTPLLILHSDEDHRCPVSQAEELFVALKLLDRDVEMVRFIGESHGLSRSGSPHNRLERLRRITDWFARKL